MCYFVAYKMTLPGKVYLMSSSLFLYKYPKGHQGRYIEDTAQKIAECFISESILKDIDDLEPWTELRVFEEEGDDAYNNVTCVSNAKLGELKRRIAELFVSSVRNVDATLDTTTGLDIPITEIRTISNIHFLLRLKLEQFETDDRVVIQLG